MRFRQPRIKNEAHLQFIRELRCVSCGNNTATQASHLRSGELKYGKRHTGMGEKPNDMWCLPLCGPCHAVQHSANEREFWNALRINPWVLAMSLYAASVNNDHEAADDIIREQARV